MARQLPDIPEPLEYLRDLNAGALTEWEQGAIYAAGLSGSEHKTFVSALALKRGWRDTFEPPNSGTFPLAGFRSTD